MAPAEETFKRMLITGQVILQKIVLTVLLGSVSYPSFYIKSNFLSIRFSSIVAMISETSTDGRPIWMLGIAMAVMLL